SMESATNLTKQLLTFAKGGDPIKETLSIGEVIIETARFSLRGSNVKLQSDIAPDLWPVEADKGQLSQVIGNLVINAQQAMPFGGVVSITAKNIRNGEGGRVQITVRDQGVGIDAQYLDKIFDPYFSTREKGSGLGLASTHSIIAKHNGAITVDSKPGQGASFIIRLPAAAPPDEKTDGKTLKAEEDADVSSVHILALDDEETVRAVIQAMMKKMGCKVSFAVEGQEAVDLYREARRIGAPYDIVIVDLTIPGGMGGKEAAREIFKINPAAKIIVSSGYATDPVMANYQAYGFKGVVAKPYLFDSLKQVVQRVLKR
ncbi:MAG: response regulator, partial [Desulfobacterales bacterium]|nr:response regulator [Desulfobacterales bacterium]